LAKLFKPLNRSKVHLKRAFVSQFGLFFKDKTSAIFIASIVTLLSIAAGWIPDGLSAFFFEGDQKKGTLMLGIGVLILLSLTYCAWKFSEKGKFEPFEDNPERKKILILFLSAPKVKDSQILLEEIKKIQETGTFSEKIHIIQKSSVKSWRMPVEAVKYHLPKLKKIVVITSPQSSEYLDNFKKLLESVFGEEIPGIVTEKQISNFENMQEVFNILDEIYEELTKEGYRNKDAIIDITGGQKINSIAGALMTLLYNDREFQYISTNTFEIKSYDVRLITDD